MFTVFVQLNTINIKCTFLCNSYGNSLNPSTVRQITPYMTSSCSIYSFHLNKGILTATKSKLLHSYPTKVCVSTALYRAYTNAEFFIRFNDCFFEETNIFSVKTASLGGTANALQHYCITPLPGIWYNPCALQMTQH